MQTTIFCKSIVTSPKGTLLAESVVDGINRTFDNLVRFPFIGRDRSSLRPGIRSIVAGVYVIFYRVELERITIMRVLHGRRDIDAEFRR